MKITVRINEFKRLLEEARRVIQPKPIIPALGRVKVDVFSNKRATVSCGDLATYLIQPFEVVDGDAGSFLLHAKKAYDFLKGYKDGTATIEADGKHSIIKVGKATAKVAGLDVNQFPPVEAMPEVKFEISLKFFKRLLERVERACPDEPGRHSVTSVKFEGDGRRLRAVASDGFRIAIAEAPCDCAEFAFQIPKSCLPPLKRREGKVFQFAQSEIDFFFRTEHGVITQVRKPLTKFPPYQKVLAMTNFKTEVKIQASDLKDALREVRATVDGKRPAFVLTVSESGLRLRTSEEEGGASETEVAATISGIPNEVELNHNFINDFLSQAEGEITVQFIGRKELVKFSNGPNYIYIMPLFLPDELKKVAAKESSPVST